MSLYCAQGGSETDLSQSDLKGLLCDALGKLGNRTHVLAIPPDHLRGHSQDVFFIANPGLGLWAYRGRF